jgi:hypothetical protein
MSLESICVLLEDFYLLLTYISKTTVFDRNCIKRYGEIVIEVSEKTIIDMHNSLFSVMNTTKISNKFFETVGKLKSFGTSLTNQNKIHKIVKSRSNSGNDC